MHAIIWALAALLNAAGVTALVLEFNTFGSPWRMLGLTLMIIGCLAAHAGFLARRSRTLDEEFEAGYRAGHRAGRAYHSPQVVVSIEGRKRAWLPSSPVRSVAGHRADARRPQAHEDRPAQRHRQDLG